MAIKKKKYRITTQAESEFLATVRRFVTKIARKAGFDEENILKIQLAVDEACTNVIKHAYKGMPRNDMRIEVQVDEHKMEVSVIDYGKGLEPNTIQSPKMNEYLKNHRRGGLGIHLIKKLVDEVKISAFPFKKNQIIMTMYRKPCSHNSGPLINEHSKQGEPRCVLRDTRRKWEKHRMKSLERN
jgi:serine/threonine-protein kinase RsbW